MGKVGGGGGGGGAGGGVGWFDDFVVPLTTDWGILLLNKFLIEDTEIHTKDICPVPS